MRNVIASLFLIVLGLVALIGSGVARILLLRWRIALTMRECRRYDALYLQRSRRTEADPEGRQAA